MLYWYIKITQFVHQRHSSQHSVAKNVIVFNNIKACILQENIV